MKDCRREKEEFLSSKGYEGSRLDVSVFNKDRESKRSKHEDEDTMCNIAASRNRKEGRIENSNPFKKTHGPSPSSSLSEKTLDRCLITIICDNEF